ncbi:MAG: response regulator [Pseudomonadota bacterium]
MTASNTPMAQRFDGRSILIVDDEFDIAATYSMLFEYHGFRVHTAGNGKQALELAAVEPPDIVVSDYMMPIMDGAQLCWQWRAHPRLCAIPFILLSAGSVIERSEVPFDLFMRKPVGFDLLLARIGELLKQPR